MKINAIKLINILKMDEARQNLLINTNFGQEDNSIIKTFTIGDIKFIISNSFAFFPKTLKQYEQLPDTQLIDENNIISGWDKSLFHTICQYLENYDVFEYLFNYIIENCAYLILGTDELKRPFGILCRNNTNYDIFKLYLNYILDNYQEDEIKKILNKGLYCIYNSNNNIFNELLQLVIKYDLSIFNTDPNENDNRLLMRNLSIVPKDLMYKFLWSFNQTTHRDLIFNKIINILDIYTNLPNNTLSQNKIDYIRYILKDIQNNNVKSAE